MSLSVTTIFLFNFANIIEFAISSNFQNVLLVDNLGRFTSAEEARAAARVGYGASEAIYNALRSSCTRLVNSGFVVDESYLFNAVGNSIVSLGDRLGINGYLGAIAGFFASSAPLFCYVGNILLGGVRSAFLLSSLPIRASVLAINNYRVGVYDAVNALGGQRELYQLVTSQNIGVSSSVGRVNRLLDISNSNNYRYNNSVAAQDTLRATTIELNACNRNLVQGVNQQVNFAYFCCCVIYAVSAIACAGLVAAAIYYACCGNEINDAAQAVQSESDILASNQRSLRYFTIGAILLVGLCYIVNAYSASCGGGIDLNVIATAAQDASSCVRLGIIISDELSLNQAVI